MSLYGTPVCFLEHWRNITGEHLRRRTFHDGWVAGLSGDSRRGQFYRLLVSLHR